MAELNTKAANELCNELIMFLTKYGIAINDAKVELYSLLHEYQIERRSMDMVVYQGNINEDLLKKFMVVKAVKGCSQRTIENYQHNISRALMRLRKPATEVTVDDIRWYIAARMKDGVSAVTCNNELRALSSFYTWMRDDEIITSNPVMRNGKIKAPKEKKFAFTEDDVELMRANLRDWREKAIFELLLSTGCRVSELVSIRIKDLREDSVNILGKGNKYRLVYINARAKLAIENYLAERKDTNPFLFPKGKGIMAEGGKYAAHGIKEAHNWYKYPELVVDNDHTGTSSIENFVRELGRKCGVENVHPHRFRRTCATFALRRGMSLELVSRMLGHENVATTQIYLDIGDEDLKAAHRRYVT